MSVKCQKGTLAGGPRRHFQRPDHQAPEVKLASQDLL